MCGAGVSDGEGCPGRRFRRGRTSEIVLCYGEILYRERMMVMGAVACGMEDGGGCGGGGLSVSVLAGRRKRIVHRHQEQMS